ncbi:DUF4265 domain-containing protein [Streptomyces sp. MT29]|nr:DUF4265 domain-containing protein [Streptomyces sp. MT29]
MSIEIPAPSHHCHVALRVGVASSGKPVFETLPARAVGSGSYELTGSPGLVEGCAAGDLLEIDADGLFQVVRRGPNLCIQAFGRPPFDAESLESLASVSVLVEWGFSNVFGADEEPLNWWHESEA